MFTLPSNTKMTAADLKASAALSPEAMTVAESIIQEIIDAVEPSLAAKAWAWYNSQNATGLFGWAEHSLLGPIFTALFGANPTPAA